MLWVVVVVILASIVMLKICCFTTCFSVGLNCNIVNVTYVVVPYLKLFISITLVAGLVDMSHQNARYCAIFRGKGRFPEEWDEDAPVPRALPVPNCLCSVPAYVKQSRCARTAGRAFYCCWIREAPPLAAPCYFLQWIDGPDKFDPRICLFLYASHVMKPYDEFQRWVPPPLNPPPMTYEEKQLATIERVNNPPLCDCGVCAYLQQPNIEAPNKFTPFFRCSLKTLVSK
jgi:hypothetical protein